MILSCEPLSVDDLGSHADVYDLSGTCMTHNLLFWGVSTMNSSFRLDSIISFHRPYIYSSYRQHAYYIDSFCAIEALIHTDASSANVNVAALFNHEEVGSVSTTGRACGMSSSL